MTGTLEKSVITGETSRVELGTAKYYCWQNEDEVQREFWGPDKKRLVFQNWKAALEFNGAVLRSPIFYRDRKSCIHYLLKYFCWRKHVTFSELLDFVKYSVLRMSSSGGQHCGGVLPDQKS